MAHYCNAMNKIPNQCKQTNKQTNKQNTLLFLNNTNKFTKMMAFRYWFMASCGGSSQGEEHRDILEFELVRVRECVCGLTERIFVFVFVCDVMMVWWCCCFSYSCILASFHSSFDTHTHTHTRTNENNEIMKQLHKHTKPISPADSINGVLGYLFWVGSLFTQR